MYNRYMGNTGKFVRVEEAGDLRPDVPVIPQEAQAPPPSPAWRVPLGEEKPPPLLTSEKAKFDLGAVGKVPEGLRGALKDRLPEVIDLGDILLVLVLLYLFLEGEEDEMLIVLGVLIFMWVFGKGDDPT